MAKHKRRFRILNIFSRNDNRDNSVVGLVKSDLYEDSMRSSPKLNFKIFTASGGYILEFYKYDYNNDRSENKLYVINNTEDLTDSIASICQQEFLQL